MPRKLTTEQFIEKARSVHGDKYTYDKAVYKQSNLPITITCQIHGDFEQCPKVHIYQKSGCQKCAETHRGEFHKDSLTDFINKASRVHKDKYNYEKVNYVNSTTKIVIICPEHGEFTQIPSEHISGKGCKKCGVHKRSNEQKYSNKEYIDLASKKHKNMYDYSKVNYTGAFKKVVIKCKIHGEFVQTAKSHLKGSGCPSCAEYGFDKSKPAILYYLKITTEDSKVLYKIGITNRSVNERFNLTELKKIEILKQEEFQNGEDAWNKEKSILDKFKEFKYKGPDVLDSGNTELFTVDILAL